MSEVAAYHRQTFPLLKQMTNTIETILSAFSAETVSELRSYFRNEVVAESASISEAELKEQVRILKTALHRTREWIYSGNPSFAILCVGEALNHSPDSVAESNAITLVRADVLADSMWKALNAIERSNNPECKEAVGILKTAWETYHASKS